MNKVLTVCCLVLCLGVLGLTQGAEPGSSPLESYKAGGTPILIPSPDSDMDEVGYDNREFMEVFVAQDNRLIAAYLPKAEIPKLSELSEQLEATRYAMVQVPRRGEYMDCSSSDFGDVTAGAKDAFGDMNSTMQEAEDEFNRRMKALDLEEATIDLGQPKQLGCLYSKPDAYCFGMIMPVAAGGKTMKMSCACTLLRVKQRILFVYLYSEFEDESTLAWLRRTAENWTDKIQQINS